MFGKNRIKKYKKELNIKPNNDGFLCDDGNRAIINVGAENYDDIFSPYCYKGGDTLSSDLVGYLQQKANAIPLDYDLTIRFHVRNANEDKRKEIELALRENYKSEIQGIDKRMNRATIFSIVFLFIGILICTTYLLIENITIQPVKYVLDLLSWVFLWEGIDAFFLERRMMQLEKLKSYRLCCAKVEIIEFEVY